MGNISNLWRSLSESQRASYQKASQDDPSADDTGSEPEGEPEQEGLAVAKTPAEAQLRQSVSLKKASDRVQNFMDAWVKKVCRFEALPHCIPGTQTDSWKK